jgi:hypothetical protein
MLPTVNSTTPGLRHTIGEARRSLSTVSVCCLTSGEHPHRLGGILRLLRPFADEIVVALDDRNADAAQLLAKVADRILLFPHKAPGDRPISFLFTECRGDWIFNIDDDEVPSLELLAELPELLRRTDVTHVWVARRWLYPSTSTYLDVAPWNTEYQLRLVRSDRRFLRFSEEFHRPVISEGPMRFVAAPLWHLDTALNSQERRLAKAEHYESMRRGMRIGAYAHNSGLYLPELRGDIRTACVPDDDYSMIEDVLGTQIPAEGGDVAVITRISREQIDEAWPGEPHSDGLHQAVVELQTSPGRLIAGARQTVDVRITNLGDRAWPAGDAFTIGVRWEGLGEGARTSLPSNVEPGDTILVPIHLDPPPGDPVRMLEIRLVHEHEQWFGEPLRLPVDIEPRRRIAVLGTGAKLDAVLRSLMLVPEIEPVLLDWGSSQPPYDEYTRVEGLGPYLFGPDGIARWGALARAGRILLRGKAAPLLHDTLSRCERLVIAGDGLREGVPPRRERLHVLVTAAAARRMGLPVSFADFDTGDGADRAFRRTLRKLAAAETLDGLPQLITQTGPLAEQQPAGRRTAPAGRRL